MLTACEKVVEVTQVVTEKETVIQKETVVQEEGRHRVATAILKVGDVRQNLG